MKAAGGDGKSLELFPGNGPRQGTGHGRRQRHRGAPVTVDGAFEDYEADLRARGSATLQRAMAVCTPYAWDPAEAGPALDLKGIEALARWLARNHQALDHQQAVQRVVRGVRARLTRQTDPESRCVGDRPARRRVTRPLSRSKKTTSPNIPTTSRAPRCLIKDPSVPAGNLVPIGR